MSFKIKRSFDPNYASLLSRPRVSYKVSEYVFDFINQYLLVPHKILQSDKYVYEFTFSFATPVPRKRKFPYKSPFATRTRLYFSQNGFRTVDKVQKWATLAAVGDDINQSITPYEYARVVFHMIGDFLIKSYKKIDRSEFEEIFEKMDRSYIDSFEFPASFEDQRYTLDDIEYPMAPLEAGTEWTSISNWVTINPKLEYLKHYPV